MDDGGLLTNTHGGDLLFAEIGYNASVFMICVFMIDAEGVVIP